MRRLDKPRLAAALAGVLLAAGCADAPPPPAKPVEPPPAVTAAKAATATATADPEPPPGDGTEASPFRMKAGEPRTLPITVVLKQNAGFVVDETADVVLTWTGGGISVQSPTVTIACESAPCLLPLAMKGAYRVDLAAPGGAGKLAVSAAALAPPKPLAIKPGRPFVLKMKPIAADDPRGPVADALLHFDAPGLQVLDIRPLGGKRTMDFGELTRQVGVEVIGPAGAPVSTTSVSPDVGGALQIAFDAAATDYVLRAKKDRPERSDSLEVTLHKPAPVRNPASDAPPPVPADAASLPRIKVGAKADFEVSPQPEPPRTWIDVPEGLDFAVTWEPSGPAASPAVELGEKNARGGSYCQNSPCLFDRPMAGPHGIYVFPAAQVVTVKAEARVLPRPEIAATIAPGGSAEVTTAASADDPRGALAEVAIDVDAAGNFDFVATIVDFKAPADLATASNQRARLKAFAPDGTPAVGPLTLASKNDIESGTSRMTVTASAAGRYVLRLDGQHSAAARKLKVACEKSRW